MIELFLKVIAKSKILGQMDHPNEHPIIYKYDIYHDIQKSK